MGRGSIWGLESSIQTVLDAIGGEQPRAILLTHIHLDHAGATGALVRRWPGSRSTCTSAAPRHLIDPSRLLEPAPSGCTATRCSGSGGRSCGFRDEAACSTRPAAAASGRARACPRARSQPEHPPRLGHRREPPARVRRHPRRPRDQLAVGPRHLAVGQIEVVLEADADVAAERQRRRQQPPTARARCRSPPTDAARPAPARPCGATLRAVGRIPPITPIMNENCSGGCEQRPCRAADPASRRARSRSTRARAGCRAPSSRSSNARIVVERVLEHALNTNSLPPRRVLRVVHRAHVQRADLGPQLAQVRHALLAPARPAPPVE